MSRLDDYKSSYRDLIINEEYNDRIETIELIELFENDARLLDESGNLINLNEGFVKSIFNFIRSITKAFSDAIDRFFGTIRDWTGVDVKWLAEHESVCKDNNNGKLFKFKEPIKNFNNYSIKQAYSRIKKIDAFSDLNKYTTIQSLEPDMDKSQDFNEYLSTINSIVDNGFTFDKNVKLSYKEQIVNYFKGSDLNILPANLDQRMRSDMFDFCYRGIQEVKEQCEKNKNNLSKFADNMSRELEKLQSSQNNEEAAAKANEEKENNNQQNQNASTLDLNATFDMYFNESTAKADDKNTDKSVSMPSPKSNAPENGAGSAGDAAANGDDNKQEDKFTKLGKSIKNIVNARSQIVSAQLKLSNKMYRQSIKILRWYVDQMESLNKSTNDTTPKQNDHIDNFRDMNQINK